MALLNDDEQQAMDQTAQLYQTIVGWGLVANGSELAGAVHVIQGFIVHRALQRVEPEHWSAWYRAEESHHPGR